MRAELKAAMREACDLLAERTYGNPARSPGHNARLILEASLQAPCLGTGELRERVARIIEPALWFTRDYLASLPDPILSHADRCCAPSLRAADAILALLSVQPVPDGEPLPPELAGPWHPDETGTFNSAGWGFTVLVPDRFWDRPDNELPPEVTAIAEALERSVRKHLNATSAGRPQDGDHLPAVGNMIAPDHFYDKDRWEDTYAEQGEVEEVMLEGAALGESFTLGRLKDLPDQFGVVAYEGDEDGVEQVIQWFDTIERAKAFRDAMMADPASPSMGEEG